MTVSTARSDGSMVTVVARNEWYIGDWYWKRLLFEVSWSGVFLVVPMTIVAIGEDGRRDEVETWSDASHVT